MKKLLVFALALSVIACMSACGNKEEDVKTDEKDNAVVVDSNVTENKEEVKEEVKEEAEEENAEESKEEADAETAEVSKEEVKEEAKEEAKEEVKEEVKEETAEEEPEVVVEPEKVVKGVPVTETTAEDFALGFMDALCGYRFAEVTEYVKADLVEEYGFSDLVTFVSGIFFKDFGNDESLIEDIKGLSDVVSDVVLNSTSYTLKETTGTDDSKTFTFDVTSVKFSDITDIITSEEVEAEANTAVAMYVATISEDKLENITEADAANVLTDMMSIMFDAYIKAVDDNKDKFVSSDCVCTVTVTNKDGKWVIDESTDINAFFAFVE